MNSLEYFNIYNYAVITLLMLLSLLVIVIYVRKINKSKSENKTSRFKKWAGIDMISGIILLSLSVTGFYVVERDINNSVSLFQPINIMVSGPIVMFMIALSFTGLVLLTIGLLYYKSSKVNRI